MVALGSPVPGTQYGMAQPQIAGGEAARHGFGTEAAFRARQIDDGLVDQPQRIGKPKPRFDSARFAVPGGHLDGINAAGPQPVRQPRQFRPVLQSPAQRHDVVGLAFAQQQAVGSVVDPKTQRLAAAIAFHAAEDRAGEFLPAFQVADFEDQIPQLHGFPFR